MTHFAQDVRRKGRYNASRSLTPDVLVVPFPGSLKMGLKLADERNAGYDATRADGDKVQIKSFWMLDRLRKWKSDREQQADGEDPGS